MCARKSSVVVLALLALPAAGATVNIEKLWLRTGAGGDPVPGRPSPIVFRELTGTDASSRPVMLPPVINNVGEVAFRARSASQLDNNVGTALGIYAKRPGFPMAVLADTTCNGGSVCSSPSFLTPTFPVPDRPAGTRFTDFKAPLINDAGDVVFFARFSGVPGSGLASGSGFYATPVSGGPIVKIADTFTTVPGHPTAAFRTFDFTISQMLTVALNNNGEVVYWGDFLIPPALFPNMTNAIFGTTVAGGPGALLCDSTQNPGFTPVGMISPFGSFSEVRPTLAINNNSPGIVAFKGNLGPPSSNPLGGVFAVSVSGGPIQSVATAFQPAPGRAGVTFGRSFGPSDDTLDVNDAGTLTFQNNFFPSFNELGHYAGTAAGGPHTRIVDGFECSFGPCLPIPAWPFPALEIVPPAEYAIGSFPNINESSQYGVYLRINNTSVPNQQGIYANDASSGLSVARVVANLSTPPPGLPAPVGGFPAFTNGGFTAESAALNDQGHMTFAAAGLLTSSTSFRGLYFYDACTAELSRITDSTVSNAVGDPGFLGSAFTSGNNRIDLWQVEGRNGHLKSIGNTFGNTNDVVFAAAFNNLDSGMFIAHVEAGGGGQLHIMCPPDVAAQCPADTTAGATGTAAATGCGDITIAFADAITPGCGTTETITRTWTADNGSTIASCVQTITEVDTTGPAISGVPEKASAECGAVPAAAEVTALDDCDGPVAVSLAESSSEGPCPGSFLLTRTWTATDACGNATEASHQVCVIDTTDPTLMGIPADATVECDSVPSAATPVSSDSCDVMPDITLTETRTDGSCPDEYTLTRVWTTIDDCGNDVSASQTVTVDDTTPPVITCPAHATLECPGDTSVGTGGSASAEDNCGASLVTHSDAVADGCGNTQTVTRSWSAADDCGNTSSCDQLLSVVDTTPPVVTCPPDANVECPGDISVPATGTATAVDACGGTTVVSSDVSETGCGPTFSIARTWQANDDCGLFATCAQTVALVDTVAPTISVDSAAIVVTDEDCSGSECVAIPPATASDACDQDVSAAHDAALCGPEDVPVPDPGDDDDDDGGDDDDDHNWRWDDHDHDGHYDHDDDDDGGDDPPAGTCEGFCFPPGETIVTYSAADDCGNAATVQKSVTVLYGADIAIHADRHVVQHGHHPYATKEPLVGILVCAYDKSDGGCARSVCGGISHHHYQCILDECEPVNCCTTDGDGRCTINAPPGDYVVISGDATKTVLPDPLGVSASDLECGETMHKHLKQIVRADGKKKSCKVTRLTGSELLIIEPEFIVWDDTEQLYPFVFETVGDWSVTATVAPPEGFVADYDALSAEVNNEVESVQFTITEVGSDLVPTQTTFNVVHNGRRSEIKSSVDIRLTPDYAVSRGFDVAQLRAKGLIVEPDREGRPGKARQRTSAAGR